MSEEDEYLSEESYEFEFEEDDEENSEARPIEEDSPENQYYYAKDLKEDSLKEAGVKFTKLIALLDVNRDTEWIFKSYKQLAKIHYQQQEYTSVLEDVRKLMVVLPGLNGNYAEESVSKILTRYAASSDHVFVKNLYDVIVNHLQDFILSGSSGHRLWLKINVNRLNNLLEINDLEACEQLIDLINDRLENVSELTKNSYALEILAAEIIFTMKTTKSVLRLGELYSRCIQVTPAITHPQVMGVIRECGATVQFFKGNYDKARVDFYESFRNYDEAGSSSKKRVLKYLMICCLLVQSEVSPFESQETQSYAQLSEYKNLMDLVDAYEKLDLMDYLETVNRMKRENDPLASDTLFMNSQDVLIHNLKVNMLLNFAKSYDAVQFDYLIKKLCLDDEDDLEHLLVEMANKGVLSCMKINFTNRYVNFSAKEQEKVFPAALNEVYLKNNVRTLYMLSYKGPWNFAGEELSDLESSDVYDSATQLHALLREEQSPRTWMNVSNIIEIIFGNNALQVDTNSEQGEWLKYMWSSIPKKKIGVSSQKDRVMFEKREESEKILERSQENDEAAANTKKGILESVVSIGLDILEETEPQKTNHKLDLMEQWAHQLGVNIRLE
ncbi:hypothetical protein METBIDRAFT_32980 [Metschnikowia bicuspidata var. bicuspidata NRRL YB-4993]|uniref:PCI domain-containing protein n=1 Tax=Metschnikowia bicuspidata var. bicuspidata NRRL YB-4993 TaxID=869754 RepID=A0A1A0H7A2_9ASCO|nr:hypothetical protein METBIDRAFT_32980 [Metschnikowia bicuspidata var. bicuspidata NRRL YB-4993]OBA19974.1 hypothetical protein METBIDRAFT_32980 [Metschnikowia bicuspidata var. bicuspidata NRRL YB-4993]